MELARQIGANLGAGDTVFSLARTFDAPGARVSAELPMVRKLAAWLVTVKNWPTAAGGVAAFAAFVLNFPDKEAVTNLLNGGTALPPGGGTLLAPGESDSIVVTSDRGYVDVDLRGVDGTLAADAAVRVSIEIQALHATPDCPAVVTPDCELPAEKRAPCEPCAPVKVCK